MEPAPFIEGAIYNRRRDIHDRFGGQRQGGVSTPSKVPFIFIFTGTSGEAHGYSDGSASDGTFHYFGEGQHGDMAFVRGNKAILEHAENGKSLLLFQILRKGKGVRYVGEHGLAGWEYVRAPDTKMRMRNAIIFKLIPLSVYSEKLEEIGFDRASTFADLRKKALMAAKVPSGQRGGGSPRSYYERSKAVRDYVLARSNGRCESCGSAAPFLRADNSSYLEPHHIRRVSDGGPDHPAWVSALCPNCHREIHHGKSGATKNRSLQEKITKLESHWSDRDD